MFKANVGNTCIHHAFTHATFFLGDNHQDYDYDHVLKAQHFLLQNPVHSIRCSNFSRVLQLCYNPFSCIIHRFGGVICSCCHKKRVKRERKWFLWLCQRRQPSTKSVVCGSLDKFSILYSSWFPPFLLASILLCPFYSSAVVKPCKTPYYILSQKTIYITSLATIILQEITYIRTALHWEQVHDHNQPNEPRYFYLDSQVPT